MRRVLRQIHSGVSSLEAPRHPSPRYVAPFVYSAIAAYLDNDTDTGDVTGAFARLSRYSETTRDNGRASARFWADAGTLNPVSAALACDLQRTDQTEEVVGAVARRKGFEPLTPRFEVWCSIQLSYRRHINATFARLRHFPSSSREQWPSTSRCQTNNPLHSNPTRQLPPLRPRTG